ncbi:unnamed protein product [Amoebophrya sp. A120]|nr:unnamed protein product [Amoebophrya sp. A120]|eukprot:GSA120T00006445001.1
MSASQTQSVTQQWPLPTLPSKLLQFSSEVEAAMRQNKEVIALESTIISHGMPFPQNLEVATRLEGILRTEKTCPATIAILDGIVHIGLERAQLEFFAKTGPQIRKVSRRDVADVLAKKQCGATTVATTMLFADWTKKIRLFVTGGIGGVHRNADQTFDISADLEEFGRSKVAVICAGAKSILDLPKTQEVLETKGCPVVGFRTDVFPTFFTRGEAQALPVVSKVMSATEAAHLIEIQVECLQTGLVLCNPIPKDKECVEAQKAIEAAVVEAEKKHILGKDVTPFLLKRVNELTKGKSLAANIALVENNAKLGAEIGKALYDQRLVQRTATSAGSTGQQEHTTAGGVTFSSAARTTSSSSSGSSCGSTGWKVDQKSEQEQAPCKITVIGGATVDYVCRPEATATQTYQLKTSLPGKVHIQCGGVGRNIAEAICKLANLNPADAAARSTSTSGACLISRVGNDPAGILVEQNCKKHCISLVSSDHHVARHHADFPTKVGAVPSSEDPTIFTSSSSSALRTAQYVAVMDDAGDLVSAIADMDILQNIRIPPLVVPAAPASATTSSSHPPEGVDHDHTPTSIVETRPPQSLFIVDGNVSVATLHEFAARLQEVDPATLRERCSQIWFEPVSTVKSLRFYDLMACLKQKQMNDICRCSLITPNYDELRALVAEGQKRRAKQWQKATDHNTTEGTGTKETDSERVRLLHAFASLCKELFGSDAVPPTVVLTCGSDGCLVFSPDGSALTTSSCNLPRAATIQLLDKNIAKLKLPVVSKERIVNTTGAGDTLMGVLAYACVYEKLPLIHSVLMGMEAAAITIQSAFPVAENLREKLFLTETAAVRLGTAGVVTPSKL